MRTHPSPGAAPTSTPDNPHLASEVRLLLVVARAVATADGEEEEAAVLLAARRPCMRALQWVGQAVRA
jgi:hypothetical protein